MTKKELAHKANKELGKNLPEKIYATTDGHFFGADAENLARDHARRYGKKLYEFTASEIADLTRVGKRETTPEKAPVKKDEEMMPETEKGKTE